MRKFFIQLIIFALTLPLKLKATPLANLRSDSKVFETLLPNRIIAWFLDICTPGSTTRVNMQKAKKECYDSCLWGSLL